MKQKLQYQLKDLVQGLDVEIQGDPHCTITGVAPIQQAQAGQISFLTNSAYRKYLESTAASAVILSATEAVGCSRTLVIAKNPYYAYAKVAAFFAVDEALCVGVHPTAVIGQRVKIAPTASIGPGCVIGDDVEIAEDVRLDARVVIYAHTKIGKRSRIASGAVIGANGFGFAMHAGAWHSVPQLGSVVIGADVDIGANTTIDRGAIENTLIGDGVKLDNLIQIGHNVKIGAHTIIAGCVAVAGSVTIGKNCMIGGATCFAGHINVCDNAVITGMTAVTKSITEPGIYSSGIVGAVPNLEFRKNNARFHRLEQLMQRVKALESALDQMTERE